MMYTFTTPRSTHTFTAVNNEDAINIANKLRLTFHADKEQCKLTVVPEAPKPVQRLKRPDPIGPHTNIPILIHNLWYTPNGGRIFDISSYKQRVRTSAAKLPQPRI